MSREEILKRRQKAAEEAGEKVLNILLGYEPCNKMQVGDVKWIAGCAREAAFAAIEKAEGPAA